MTKILLFILLITSINANEYLVIEKRVFTKTLGKIKDFSTIEKGYLMATPDGVGSAATLKYDNIVFHESGRKPLIEGRVKYKVDRNHLLKTLRFIINKKPSTQTRIIGKYKVKVDCFSNTCNYTREHMKKGKIYKGYLTFNKDNILTKMCDHQEKVCFKLIEYDIMKLLN